MRHMAAASASEEHPPAAPGDVRLAQTEPRPAQPARPSSEQAGAASHRSIDWLSSRPPAAESTPTEGSSQPAARPPIEEPPPAAPAADGQSQSSQSAATESAGTEDDSQPAAQPAIEEAALADEPQSAPAEAQPPQQAEAASQQLARSTTARSTATASVAFVPSDSTSTASEAPQNAEQPAGQRLQRSDVSFASRWRWASEPGKLPAYVQRTFRLKAYALVFAQLSLVLVGSLMVSELEENDLVDQVVVSSSTFWVLCALSVVCIVALYYYKQVYPCNYVLLAINTVTITLTWSLGGSDGVLFKEKTYLHLQVLAILVVAIFVTAAVGHFMSLCKLEPELLVPASFLIGWLIGSMANWFFLLANPDVFENTALMAAGIAFLLYGIVLIDVGGKLMSGNPDNFMRIVVAFDSTMLVVTSIPFLVLSFCLVRSFKHAEEREQRSNVGRESGGLPPVGLLGTAGAQQENQPAQLPRAPNRTPATAAATRTPATAARTPAGASRAPAMAAAIRAPAAAATTRAPATATRAAPRPAPARATTRAPAVARAPVRAPARAPAGVAARPPTRVRA